MLALGTYQLGDVAAAQTPPAITVGPAAEQERTAAAAAPATSQEGASGQDVTAGSDELAASAGQQPPGGTPEGQPGAASHGHEDGRAVVDPDRPGSSGSDSADGEGAGGAGGPVVNGLQTLGRSCEQSFLEPHSGFQEAPRCVETAMGEVPAAERGPQLLITSAPDSVQVNEEFTIQVSSRNLVRDRFLGAADGGYYVESSFLNSDGLVRGHYHLACRTLQQGTGVAPEPLGGVVFFEAVEDAGGGFEPDTVEITVPGLETRGPTQCAVWAGDGSHRIPMMETAQQFPAFDAVRLLVW